MTDRDSIPLPREVARLALSYIEWYIENEDGGRFVQVREAEAILRTALASPRLEVTVDPRLTAEEAAAISAALAAEQPKHPGYVIGSHWLETAYSRVCAGEAEADVLRDCGWERVDESLRRDAERHRWLRGEHSRIDPCIKANAKYRLQRDSGTWVEIHDLDAAIDAAMGDKT